MILYYDNYITNKPWISNTIKSISNIRKGNTIYKYQNRLDIAKYTLASYKVFPWSKIIIKFDAEKEEDKKEFERYAREIFPDAEIITHRSDNQKEYCKTISEICKLDDEWIFYIPNNDHPMIIDDINYIYKLLEVANKYKKEYKFISINFSMFSENNNKDHLKHYKNSKIKYDTDLARIVLYEKGYLSSSQIVNKDLLKHLYCSHDLEDARITRFEDIAEFFNYSEDFVFAPNQLVILPKKEMCAHFDGYSHTYRRSDQISPDQVPPLFIPPGFFENNIRIAYGYKEYRDGWVNINPDIKYYSFRNKKYRTDLKIGVNDIPLFWRSRVTELDINPDADFCKLKNKRDEYYKTLYNPWKDLYYRIQIKIISFLYFDIYVSSVVFIKKLLNK